MSEVEERGTSDRRLLRGARSRRALLRRAVDVASVDGLDGLSLGGLAGDLGVSKSGVQTLFGSKENLQVATVECARGVFEEAVVRPARSAARGVERFRALVDAWIVYAEGPLFPGGCFWAANLGVFDGRPGRVRDVLFADRSGWRGLLAGELRYAVEAGQVVEVDVDLVVFQVDAVLLAANTAVQLGEAGVGDRVRRVVDGLLAAP
ncbi:TetR/AcrR family transcriptional regulator [Streptomyces sp. NPDC050095]|uniref:TetR family transcriptional regulator C-terminal domain-containing protein n=1 Tax=unclassified Streptomyces TaxID=2593676 RepID=UPI00344A6083